eukprot:997625-Pyramimonas_sp.AAC.1
MQRKRSVLSNVLATPPFSLTSSEVCPSPENMSNRSRVRGISTSPSHFIAAPVRRVIISSCARIIGFKLSSRKGMGDGDGRKGGWERRGGIKCGM